MSSPTPTPVIHADNAAFYEATAKGELRFQRCNQCEKFRHYPRPACPHCLSRSFRWAPVSGEGSVYTWTIVHRPTLPAFHDKLPYNVVDILLDEGIHFVSEIVDCEAIQITAGARVSVVFVHTDAGITLPKFRLTSTT